MKIIFGLKLSIFLASFSMMYHTALGQGTEIKKGGLITAFKNSVDEPIERHKWEVNVNIIPLLKLQSSDNWTYTYLIKRNVGLEKSFGAWRFMINPYLLRKNQKFAGDSTFNYTNPKSTYFTPSVVLGFEWQNIMGRFTFFYGSDLGWRTELATSHDDKAIQNSINGPISGVLRTKSIKNALSISPLIGGKYYLNHRFSLSLESQVRFLYSQKKQSTHFNGRQVFSENLKEPEIATFASYVLNLSYNF